MGVALRVCVVMDDSLPNSTRVGAKMMHELCVEFVRRGHEVTLIAPKLSTQDLRSETYHGIKVRRFPTGRTKGVAKWRRAINEAMLPLWAWIFNRKYFIKNKHDVIVFYSPCIFWAPLISRLKSCWGAPAFLVLRDFFPQWAIDNGMLSEKSLLTRFFRLCEGETYAVADVIGIQSPRNIERFKSSTSCDRRIELLYNWAEDRSGKASAEGLRSRLGLHGKVIFFYGGAITNQQDVPSLLRLAEGMLRHPDAHFVFVGEGYELPNVVRLVKDRGLSNVTVLPPVDQDEYRSYLAEVDIGLFSLSVRHTTHNFPGKVLGYLVQGIPVLGFVNPGNDLLEVINCSGAGFVAVNGEDEIVKIQAERFLIDGNARKDAGAAARKLLESTFSVESAATLIIRSLEEVR